MSPQPLALSTDSWTWQLIALVLSVTATPVVAHFWSLLRPRAQPKQAAQGATEFGPCPQVRPSPATLVAVAKDRQASTSDGSSDSGNTTLLQALLFAVSLGIGVAHFYQPRLVQLALVAFAALSAGLILRQGRTLTADTGDSSWRRFFTTFSVAVACTSLAAIALWWQPFAGSTGQFLRAATGMVGPQAALAASGLGEWLLVLSQGLGAACAFWALLETWRTLIGLTLEVRVRQGYVLGWPSVHVRQAESRRDPTPALVRTFFAAAFAAFLCSGALVALEKTAFENSHMDLVAPRLVARIANDDVPVLLVASSEVAKAKVSIAAPRPKSGSKSSNPHLQRARLKAGTNRIDLEIPEALNAERVLVVQVTATDAAGKTGVSPPHKFTP